ncbi:MAG: hypothetical protein KAX80_05505 [Planctomycetes bacterium]|nr:hypothetical protein [Planctomycetota bacterium]
MSREEEQEKPELTEEQREELRRLLARAASVIAFVFGGFIDGDPIELDRDVYEGMVREGEWTQ